MPKKKKFKVKRHELAAENSLRKNLGRFNWALLGKLALSFAIIFGIFQLAIQFEFGAIYPIYFGLFVVVFALFGYFNHGFSKEIPTRDELIIPEEQKDAFLEKVVRDRKIAKKLLIILIPLILTIIIDIIYIFYLDGLFTST